LTDNVSEDPNAPTKQKQTRTSYKTTRPEERSAQKIATPYQPAYNLLSAPIKAHFASIVRNSSSFSFPFSFSSWFHSASPSPSASCSSSWNSSEPDPSRRPATCTLPRDYPTQCMNQITSAQIKFGLYYYYLVRGLPPSPHRTHQQRVGGQSTQPEHLVLRKTCTRSLLDRKAIKEAPQAFSAPSPPTPTPPSSPPPPPPPPLVPQTGWWWWFLESSHPLDMLLLQKAL